MHITGTSLIQLGTNKKKPTGICKICPQSFLKLRNMPKHKEQQPACKRHKPFEFFRACISHVLIIEAGEPLHRSSHQCYSRECAKLLVLHRSSKSCLKGRCLPDCNFHLLREMISNCVCPGQTVQLARDEKLRWEGKPAMAGAAARASSLACGCAIKMACSTVGVDSPFAVLCSARCRYSRTPAGAALQRCPSAQAVPAAKPTVPQAAARREI